MFTGVVPNFIYLNLLLHVVQQTKLKPNGNNLRDTYTEEKKREDQDECGQLQG